MTILPVDIPIETLKRVLGDGDEECESIPSAQKPQPCSYDSLSGGGVRPEISSIKRPE